MNRVTLTMAMAAISDRGAVAADVAKRLGITTTTLYVYVNGDGTPKAPGGGRLPVTGQPACAGRTASNARVGLTLGPGLSHRREQIERLVDLNEPVKMRQVGANTARVIHLRDKAEVGHRHRIAKQIGAR